MSVYCVQYYFIRLAKQSIFIVFKIYDFTPCICQVNLHLQYVVFEYKKNKFASPTFVLSALVALMRVRNVWANSPRLGPVLN